MPRSRKSLGTPVAGSSSAARRWEAVNPKLRFSLFSDPNTQGALGRSRVRLEMAGI